MVFKYFNTTFIALCYVLSDFTQQVCAQQCQKDSGSAFYNPENMDVGTLFTVAQHGFCGGVADCSMNCLGPLSSKCEIPAAAVCTDSSFPCDQGQLSLAAAFSTIVYNDCTKEHFYYGEIVHESYRYTGDDSVLFSVKTSSWPNAKSLYEGNGVIQMGDLSKYYSFSHQMPSSMGSLGTYSDSYCYQRFPYAFLNSELFGSNNYPNFGAGKPPAIGTCASETSCPLDDCSILGKKCCFDGTCICTKDTSICADASKLVTATSTNACKKNPTELFYYGEFVTALPINPDSLFISSLTKKDGFWFFVGMGVLDISNLTYVMRKDVFFLHKYPV